MSDQVGGEAEVVPAVEAPPESPPPLPEPPRPPEPPRDTRIGPIGVALITMAVAMPGYLVLSMVGTFLNLALSVVLAQVGLLAAAVIVLRLSRRSVSRFTGLVGSHPKAYLMGAAIGLGNSLLFNGPIHVFSKSLFPEWLVKMFDITELLSQLQLMPLEQTAFFFAAVVMAPIIEELLFRGVFFRALSGWSAVGAAIITAVVFSAYHLDPVGFLARLQVGLVLAWLFWKTKSLGACIAAHAANNLLAMGGALLVERGAQDPTEPLTLAGWIPMLAVGALLFFPAAIALWRSEPERWATPADDPEMPRRSFFAEVLPWATGVIFTVLLAIRVDSLGAQLTTLDLTTPVRSAKTPLEQHEREVMKRLRKAARDGNGSVQSYSELRNDLSRREGR